MVAGQLGSLLLIKVRATSTPNQANYVLVLIAAESQRADTWSLNDWIEAARRKPDSAGVQVPPKRGSAVVFSNLISASGLVDPLALHAAMLSEREKWVANVWITER